MKTRTELNKLRKDALVDHAWLLQTTVEALHRQIERERNKQVITLPVIRNTARLVGKETVEAYKDLRHATSVAAQGISLFVDEIKACRLVFKQAPANGPRAI